MAAGQVTLPVIEQGATYSHNIYWKSPSGVAIDLTGATAKMQLRSSVDSPIVILELSSANGRITIDPLLGKISLNVSSTDTTLLPAGKYVYDLEVFFYGGTVIRLIEGKVTIKAEVTRG